jgi:hypothetical protein
MMMPTTTDRMTRRRITPIGLPPNNLSIHMLPVAGDGVGPAVHPAASVADRRAVRRPLPMIYDRKAAEYP